jgi:sterol desaturase/sphingolipid hydroxylase (fatty acid hydroxylase superfamily)
VIAIGENLPILRSIDRAAAAQRPWLLPLFVVLVACGFALFMGGIIHLILSRGRASEEISFRELKKRWREGTLRETTRLKRFLVILAGVFLMMAAGAAAAIAFAPPGAKLIVILAAAYVATRLIIGFRAV